MRQHNKSSLIIICALLLLVNGLVAFGQSTGDGFTITSQVVAGGGCGPDGSGGCNSMPVPGHCIGYFQVHSGLPFGRIARKETTDFQIFPPTSPGSFPSQQPQVGFCFLQRVVDGAGIAGRADGADGVRRRGENLMRFLCLGLQDMKAAISFK